MSTHALEQQSSQLGALYPHASVSRRHSRRLMQQVRGQSCDPSHVQRRERGTEHPSVQMREVPGRDCPTIVRTGTSQLYLYKLLSLFKRKSVSSIASGRRTKANRSLRHNSSEFEQNFAGDTRRCWTENRNCSGSSSPLQDLKKSQPSQGL